MRDKNTFIESNKELIHQAVHSVERLELCFTQTFVCVRMCCMFVCTTVPVGTYTLEFIAEKSVYAENVRFRRKLLFSQKHV